MCWAPWSLWLPWALLRSLRGAPYATLATLAALCITFYNGRLYYFNHNVVLTLWVACAVMVTGVPRRRSAPGCCWGLVSGLGLLTKYQFVLALATIGLWWLHLRGWRHPIHRQGALWAAVCALAVCAPHFHWLQTQGWMPFAYARSASLRVRPGGGAARGRGAGVHARLVAEPGAARVAAVGVCAGLAALRASVQRR